MYKSGIVLCMLYKMYKSGIVLCMLHKMYKSGHYSHINFGYGKQCPHLYISCPRSLKIQYL